MNSSQRRLASIKDTSFALLELIASKRIINTYNLNATDSIDNFTLYFNMYVLGASVKLMHAHSALWITATTRLPGNLVRTNSMCKSSSVWDGVYFTSSHSGVINKL